jgi:putative ABC transport system permease protein
MIKENIPGIKRASLFNHYTTEINYNNQFFKVPDFIVADETFINMFNPGFIYGSPETPLQDINSVIISESMAKAIFGKTNVVGKTIMLEHTAEMYISGVIKDYPTNSSFKADVIASYKNSLIPRFPHAEWRNPQKTYYPFNIFIELENNQDVKRIEKQIASFHKIDPMNPEIIKLEPIKANYFNTELNDRSLPHANNSLIKILTWVGAIILLLAVINFINLTTASYKYKLTEIGIKKCFGVNRAHLIKQMLAESFLTCIIASVIGIFIAELIRPYFNDYIEKPLKFQLFTNPEFIFIFIGFIAVLSIITGFIPALVLSKISPLQLFKSLPHTKGTDSGFRNVLTTFQFAVTIILICCLVTMMLQINYVKHREPGFKTDKLMYLVVHYRTADKIPALYDRITHYHTVVSATKTFGIPGNVNMTENNIKTIYIDSTTLKTFGFKLVSGRELLPGDLNKAYVVNQTYWKKLQSDNFNDTVGYHYEIAGVVSNFQFESLYSKNEPLKLIYTDQNSPTHITFRINGSVAETIKYLEKTWKELCPDYPLEYGFYDEYFAAQYKKEENLATLISMFSVLAIVISCLGIFGLAFYQSEQRVKEIGIRKVLGASSSEIVGMLTGSFSKWVLLANVFAWPAAYYFMTKWLETFAYRIELSWWMFALSGVIALVIALVTISTQTIKAAIANPVKSLKYE